jgi:hypothetical protein
MKRCLEHKDTGSRKTVNVEGEAKSVNDFGSETQRRAALTASVSPDAVRFVPPQVKRKNAEEKMSYSSVGPKNHFLI